MLDPSYWVTLMCGESGPEVWWEQLTWDKCASTRFHLLFLKRCRNKDITWTSCKTTPEAIQPSRMSMPYPCLVSPCLWLWLQAESHDSSQGTQLNTVLLVSPSCTSSHEHSQDVCSSTPENQLGFCTWVDCFRKCKPKPHHSFKLQKKNASTLYADLNARALPPQWSS